ncbi:MAG: leucyl/phenylalanyl-tRNA--protein transferase [Candidatus Riflebacteria bacterium]|nr:leucyl/phenylalanyl-tRNA--protein transferase [Candidatus Riflebacteria bacterium]
MNQILFPDPELADDDGLLAFGGDLRPETLLQAYSSGIFPWSVKPISWWSPDPRAIFELDKFRPSTRMARLYRSGRFSFSIDKNFEEVMHGCARPAPGRETTWISPEFIRAYSRMHELGYAHSVEVWSGGKLAGGIYGVAIGGVFAGESMFTVVSNASTMGLIFLINHLNSQGFKLFDSQVLTPHTSRLGAVEISRAQYLTRLKAGIICKCKF